MKNTLKPIPRIVYQRRVYHADPEQLRFVCIEITDTIPFHRFTEGEWLLLEWEKGKLSYEEIITDMHIRLENCQQLTKEILAMSTCVKHYYESRERYEELQRLKNVRPILFGPLQVPDGSNVDMQRIKEATAHIRFKTCEPGQNYVYDIHPSKISYTTVFRHGNFRFDWVNTDPDLKKEKVFDLRKKWRGYQFGAVYKRDVTFRTLYIRIVSEVSGDCVGYLHIYTGEAGIKEVHHNSRIKGLPMYEFATLFVALHALPELEKLK